MSQVFEPMIRETCKCRNLSRGDNFDQYNNVWFGSSQSNVFISLIICDGYFVHLCCLVGGLSLKKTVYIRLRSFCPRVGCPHLHQHVCFTSRGQENKQKTRELFRMLPTIPTHYSWGSVIFFPLWLDRIYIVIDQMGQKIQLFTQ